MERDQGYEAETISFKLECSFDLKVWYRVVEVYHGTHDVSKLFVLYNNNVHKISIKCTTDSHRSCFQMSFQKSSEDWHVYRYFRQSLLSHHVVTILSKNEAITTPDYPRSTNKDHIRS
jgi:hypothetical protein